MDPWRYSLRDLSVMAEVRRNEDWDRCASLIAAISNANVTKRSALRSPLFFHPFRDHNDGDQPTDNQVSLSPQESVSLLKGILLQ